MSTPNDRELLEGAAKAASIDAVLTFGADFEVSPPIKTEAYWLSDENGHWLREWNPLTDDGDAFRLACKLNMTIGVESDAQAVWWAGDSLEEINEPLGSDPCAAMRRAIVRAAYEIGSAKP